jgi:hypothetical protein
VPVEALHVSRRIESFCWHVRQLVGAISPTSPLLGKAPLPEELRGALGIRDDDEDEDGAEIGADEDREGDGVVEE